MTPDEIRCEYEANWFAMAFTMPESHFRKSFAELNGCISALSERYGVPRRIVHLRAQGLGLIPVKETRDGQGGRVVEGTGRPEGGSLVGSNPTPARLASGDEVMETQQTIGQWADEAFGKADPNSPRMALRMLEEAIEMCVAAGANAADMMAAANSSYARAVAKDNSSIAKEAGDVLVTLYRAAEVYGFDLHAACEERMANNRRRQWKRHGDGTGQHIKGAASVTTTPRAPLPAGMADATIGGTMPDTTREAKLRAAAAPFLRRGHASDCALRRTADPEFDRLNSCTCGLDALRAALDTEEGKV